MSVAGIILSQLGGNKFCAMTGAKNFVSGENSLSFALPKMSGVKVNRVRVILVRVVLAIDDTYTVSFFNIRAVNAEPVSTHAGVYCEDLRGVFERETGLRTLVGSRVYRTPWKRPGAPQTPTTDQQRLK